MKVYVLSVLDQSEDYPSYDVKEVYLSHKKAEIAQVCYDLDWLPRRYANVEEYNKKRVVSLSIIEEFEVVE